MVIVTVAPDASDGNVAVTVFPVTTAVTPPTDVVAETTVTSVREGRVSVKTTPEAEDGPLLTAVTV
jgi:hypothetical protein